VILLRIRRSLKATLTTTASHIQPIELTTTNHREVEAPELGLSLN
jgi:hypothetical protein